MKKVLIILFILITGLTFIYLNQNNLINFYNNEIKNLKPIEIKINNNLKQLNEPINEIKNEVSLPDPIISKQTTEEKTNLTNQGILNWTNFYRQQNGLQNLNLSQKLNDIATLRAKDMFEKQYFSHYSPTGIGAPQIAADLNYEYIAIGENIALGNFKNDKDLVDAWMSSPGHRANILNSKYTDIGIAVMYGKFKDEKMEKEENVWIAVQVFSKPMTCIKPDENLKNEINSLKPEIENLKQQASDMYDYLSKNNVLHSREEVINFNEKVLNYNNLVKTINEKIEELKVLAAKYNLQVEMFNNCINL
jgi:uncharacterized protein YkwD